MRVTQKSNLQGAPTATRADILAKLDRVQGGPNPVLRRVMAKGVAFHHAGKILRSCDGTDKACCSAPRGVHWRSH